MSQTANLQLQEYFISLLSKNMLKYSQTDMKDLHLFMEMREHRNFSVKGVCGLPMEMIFKKQ